MEIFNIYSIYIWKILSVFSNHIIVCQLFRFKNPIYFEIDWVRFVKENFLLTQAQRVISD